MVIDFCRPATASILVMQAVDTIEFLLHKGLQGVIPAFYAFFFLPLLDLGV